MQQSELVIGFSELKDLLIQTYKINRDRSSVKLYFSHFDNKLILHDYDDHQKIVTLCYDIQLKEVPRNVVGNARRLTREALDQNLPSQFLNNGFLLYGFFKS